MTRHELDGITAEVDRGRRRRMAAWFAYRGLPLPACWSLRGGRR